MEKFKYIPFLGCCLAFLCAGLPGPAWLHSQAFNFDFFTVNEGLSDRQITALHIGEEGFVWVGTRDGLNRFDGYSFLPFGQGPFSSTGLSLGHIAKIGSDIEGKFSIFYKDVHTYFDRFDPESFVVQQVQLAPSSGVQGFPRAFATDELGRIFTVTLSRQGTRLYEYTPEGFQLLSFLAEARSSIASAVQLCPLSNGQFVLFDTEKGLRHLNAAGEVLQDISLSNTKATALFGSGNFERVNFLEEAPNEQLLFSFFGHEGLFHWTIGREEDASPYLAFSQQAYYQQLFKDKQGQLLLGCRNTPGAAEQSEAFYLIDQKGTILRYQDLQKAGSRIYAAAADDFTEKIFLGRYDGLGVAETPKKKLWNFLAVEQEEEYQQNIISGICEDAEGNIYCSESSGQLYRINPLNNLSDTISLQITEEGGQRLDLSTAASLRYDSVQKAVWGIGQKLGKNRESYLFCYYTEQCTARAYKLSGHRFTTLSQGWGGQWVLGAEQIGSPNGKILLFDTLSGSFLPLLEKEMIGFLHNTIPQYTSLSKNGLLLLGSSTKGLLLYDPQKRSSQSYQPASSGNEEVVFNDYSIKVVHESEEDILWIGTQGGLHRLDIRNSELQFYGRKDGLSSNIIYGILADERGGFWLSTANGITHLKRENGETEFRRYYRSDGLSSDEFSPFAFHRARDGRYYFGGVNGLSAFYPDELTDLATEAKVVITQIILYGREQTRVLNRRLEEIQEVTVRANEKGIAVQFALPAITRADRNRFRVMLEGLQTDWVELNNEHTARFNNLNAGRYTLHIQGADANGNYASSIVSIPIRVRQYIYERTWFLVLMGLLIAGLVIGFLQSRARERLRTEQLRTQLSSDIHDEVSGLLAGITLQTELLQSYTEDDHLRTRLAGIGEAGRKAMSKMSDVIWSIDSRRDTVADLLQRMQEHADDVLLPLDIRYTFRAEGLGKDRQDKLSGNKRQDLYFIYKEAINNIARHSNATQVSVAIIQRNNEFEMLIHDNGTPDYSFDTRRSVKTGQGLANLQMRAQRLDAQLHLDTSQGYAIQLKMRRLN